MLDWRMRSRCTSRILVLACLLSPAWAGAAEPVVSVAAVGGYACRAEESRQHGMSAGLDGAYAFDSFWAIKLAYQRNIHSGNGASFSSDLVSFGIRYQLDVLAIVPWVDLAPTLIASRGEGGPADTEVAVSTGFGLDWLLDETLFIGVATRFHQVLGAERFPAFLDVQARLGLRWSLGDPFDD